MIALGHRITVIPAKAGIHDTLQQRCVIGSVARADTGVDGGLRRHDEMGRAVR
ncbi:MAG: hypothetical protein WDN31_09220 [Hyphomicrobium sp.]